MNLAVIYSLINTLWALPTIFRSILPHRHLDIAQFEVYSLPGAPSLPTSWAGRIPVPDTEPGNSLFFWHFQAEDIAHDDNLIIWFNGGPGCSSLIGLMSGNGPLSFVENSTELVRNPYSWTRLGHVLYIDQPVGTGLSTASEPYPLSDNEGVTSYLYAWLQSFFAHFPHLRSKQIHLMGESYAGIYIPYIAATIMRHQASFPLNLRSMSLGDATFGNAIAMSSIPTVAYLRSKQSLLQTPPDIVKAFIKADSICGFDQIIQSAAEFPPKGPIPIPDDADDDNDVPEQTCSGDTEAAAAMQQPPLTTPEEILSSILNSTTCDGSCAIFSTASRYLSSSSRCFDIYDLTNNCTAIDPLPLLSSYFSRPDVQNKPQQPPSPRPPNPSITSNQAKPYHPCNDTLRTLILKDGQLPAPPAEQILPDLITTHNLALHIYAGDSDFLLNHYGIELVLQNMTWRGAQGFSRSFARNYFYTDDAAPPRNRSCAAEPPSGRTSKKCDELPTTEAPAGAGAAGLWTSSRGVTYHLFWDAGHAVFAKKPREMFAFVRDVVLGSGDWDSE
ncbi:putative serine carboxypeptidase [Aspergillus homomorphus CBS 101889]|uniref:Carboxypeptidase n=1 Tax=Aspergillus homomorphus (strain CBS 101889) TaxID=1450537 RepID=A0A395HM52_ASPHC|nr:putative serine carboxypeptidase [Aspergillus homomorphus CBS 101889]RAL09011.1 putative serine carboxypeptidase [Aspergillus homomorphus CBS 101889]